ncbi:MAG: DUF192 domain-containing protein [Acidobacteriaceae bacterium]|nr:DUF192 domain-containing protein [Acidobacteriaceae bacterium]
MSNWRQRMSKLVVRNLTRGTILAEAASLAGTSATRLKGLLGRTSFPSGEGLWIAPCEAVHTIGMQFPIDVLFLSRNRQVVKIRHRVPSWRLAACLRAHSVLELPAGTALSTKTEPGDHLDISEVN